MLIPVNVNDFPEFLKRFMYSNIETDSVDEPCLTVAYTADDLNQNGEIGTFIITFDKYGITIHTSETNDAAVRLFKYKGVYTMSAITESADNEVTLRLDT